MQWNGRQLLWKLVLICSLLSPFVFFSAVFTSWGSRNILGVIAQELIYPIEYIGHATTKSVTAVWTNYFALSHAAIENAELKSKITQLSTQLLDYEEKQSEIIRLRELLGLSQHIAKEKIVAEVISNPRNLPFHIMRVSKGELNGVKIGMPVVTGGGVVGRVIRTGLNYADVHLLSDPNFYLDVLLLRSRVRGVLKGEFGTSCTLKLNRRAEIKIGDTIITSGIVGGFPKGLPVGQVVRISYESDNITQSISIEPWVDYRRVEEVIILQNNDREMQKIVETAGKGWLRKSFDQATGSGGLP